MPFAFVKPMMVRTVVVLPAPFRPMSAALTPGCKRETDIAQHRRIGDRDVDVLETQHRRHIPITCSRTFGSARTSAGVPTFWILPMFHTATRLA